MSYCWQLAEMQNVLSLTQTDTAKNSCCKKLIIQQDNRSHTAHGTVESRPSLADNVWMRIYCQAVDIGRVLCANEFPEVVWLVISSSAGISKGATCGSSITFISLGCSA